MLLSTLLLIVVSNVVPVLSNFGLTGKAQLRPGVSFDLNIEADVIAKKGEEGLLRRSEDGSYIVPETSYGKVDLSVDETLHKGGSPKLVNGQEALLRRQRLAGTQHELMMNDDHTAHAQGNQNRGRFYPRTGYGPGFGTSTQRIPMSSRKQLMNYPTDSKQRIRIPQHVLWNRYAQRMRRQRMYHGMGANSGMSSTGKRSVAGKNRPYGKRHLYGQYRAMSRQQAVNSHSYKFPKEFESVRNNGDITDSVITNALKNLHHLQKSGGGDYFEQKIPIPDSTLTSVQSNQPKRISNQSRDVKFLLSKNTNYPRANHNSNGSTEADSKVASSLRQTKEINRTESRAHCEKLNLSRKQLKLCKRDSGMPQVLEEATRMAATECQYQFRYERWNCSIGSSRIFLLDKGNRETAFLFAISSAGLTHSVAKACANGHLERCSCEETYSDIINQEAWRWGGCGDNVLFATKFVHQFLKSRGQGQDIRAEVDKHNSNLGIRIVKQSVQQTCKCHGVSGSCTTKTCWRKVSPFYDIGKTIKKAYDRAVKVGSLNRANGRTKLVRIRRGTKQSKPSTTRKINIWENKRYVAGSKPTRMAPISKSSSMPTRTRVLPDKPRSTELVFIDKSPKYCRKSRYSVGTSGRICDRKKNCDKICCGRGYTTQTKVVRKSCECEVKWCCYVKCKTCVEERVVHTCK